MEMEFNNNRDKVSMTGMKISELKNEASESSSDMSVCVSIKSMERKVAQKQLDDIFKMPQQKKGRTLRKCRYAGTYNVKNWEKPMVPVKKNISLKERLVELEKLMSQNKSTGILLDYDENEAKKFFEALGIRRISPKAL